MYVYMSFFYSCFLFSKLTRYVLASGGGDNMVKMWDLRKKKSMYTIPAHSNTITAVK